MITKTEGKKITALEVLHHAAHHIAIYGEKFEKVDPLWILRRAANEISDELGVRRGVFVHGKKEWSFSASLQAD